MILKILGVGYVSSVKVMMVLFGLVLKIRDYFIFIRKVERLKNSHILLFIKMFMVYVWTVMICG
jgi:extradiol dioxygenase family protein